MFEDGRAGYLYVIDGTVLLNGGDTLRTGDAVKVFGAERVHLRAEGDVELILVDVPAHVEPVGVWAR